MGGGGSRWREEQDEVLDFAKKLHYDHSPGGSLIPETDDKDVWVDWRDDFASWKDKNVALEDSGQAWWQTYKDGEGGGGGGTGTPRPDSDNPDPGKGTGPYPDSNMYFPMLVPEYNDPKAQDWSQYMSQGGSGLLFQPWSQEYGEQYMQPNIWNYQPPELKVGRPKYFQNPLGIMDVVDYVPPSESKEPTEEEKIASGNYDGTGGDSYGAGSHGGMMPGDRGYLLGLAIAAAKAAAAEAADRLGGDKHDDGNDAGDSGGHHGGAEGGAGGGHSNK
jgi:hypothetical protein